MCQVAGDKLQVVGVNFQVSGGMLQVVRLDWVLKSDLYLFCQGR